MSLSVGVNKFVWPTHQTQLQRISFYPKIYYNFPRKIIFQAKKLLVFHRKNGSPSQTQNEISTLKNVLYFPKI